MMTTTSWPTYGGAPWEYISMSGGFHDDASWRMAELQAMSFGLADQATVKSKSPSFDVPGRALGVGQAMTCEFLDSKAMAWLSDGVPMRINHEEDDRDLGGGTDLGVDLINAVAYDALANAGSASLLRADEWSMASPFSADFPYATLGHDAFGHNDYRHTLQEPDTSATEPLRLVVGFEPAVGFKPAAATPVCNAASWRPAPPSAAPPPPPLASPPILSSPIGFDAQQGRRAELEGSRHLCVDKDAQQRKPAPGIVANKISAKQSLDEQPSCSPSPSLTQPSSGSLQQILSDWPAPQMEEGLVIGDTTIYVVRVDESRPCPFEDSLEASCCPGKRRKKQNKLRKLDDDSGPEDNWGQALSPEVAEEERKAAEEYEKLQGEDLNGRALCIAYFPRAARAVNIRAVFKGFGAVRQAYVVRNKAGYSKCYGFVCFEDQEAAQMALDTCDAGKVIMNDGWGKAWHVKASWAKNPAPLMHRSRRAKKMKQQQELATVQCTVEET